jgi:hypothetical protein
VIHFFIGLLLGLLAAELTFAVTGDRTLYLIAGIATPVLYWLIVAVAKGKIRFDFDFDFFD